MNWRGIKILFLLGCLKVSLMDTKNAFPESDLVISIITNGSYRLLIKGETWLINSPTFFNIDGRTFSTRDKTLTLEETTETSGEDMLGKWQSTTFHYSGGRYVKVGIDAIIKTYYEPDWPFIIFSQKYLNGANGTKALDRVQVVGGFPGFHIESNKGTLGYLSFGGFMIGDTNKHIGSWNNNSFFIRDGLEGGPLVLFNQNADTLIISPFSQFMASSVWHDGLYGGSVYWGIMGDVESVPPNFQYDTIVYYANGISKAFEGWGEVLRKWYNRDDAYVKSDLTINYLGYWTDNGAFYYYNTEKGVNYEQTILDVKAYTDQMGIPYRYFQYDSWFYYKGLAQGIKTWEARPDVFPDGFPFVTNKTLLPAAAHNRYWARDTTYAKQNGGMYNFLLEELKGLPLDEVFWRDLFTNATKWGLILYEQDWLNVEFRGVPSLLNNVHMGRQWLMLMGAGAKATNIRIQYCMANPRHAMQALEIPVVTQARVSDDYGPGADQWRIGISSMFAHAIGLAPYKDTFWTTEHQSGNPYGINRHEPYAALNAAVSTLSTGPVGPSDKIGATDVTMLMRCCNKDGLILKPSRPLMAIDQQLIKAAFPSFSGVDGEVWTTFSEISGLKFGILLAADIKNTVPMIILPRDTGIFRVNESVGQYVAFPYDNVNRWKLFSATNGLSISNNCTKTNFCLYHLSPQLPNSAYVLGELDKWVPISPQRVREIEMTTDDVNVRMTGLPGEAFDFWYIYKNETYNAKCLINTEGSAVFVMKDGICG